MKHISSLFDKYQNRLVPPQTSIIKEFVVVCQEVCGFTITPEQCTYTVATKTIYITVPSVLKSELMQNETKLKQALKERLGKNAPTNIV